MNNPIVSVVMPVYNGEKYLKEAIGSILAQSLKEI
ncbi:glycosyltransferase, partial [Daejeonella sp.]